MRLVGRSKEGKGKVIERGGGGRPGSEKGKEWIAIVEDNKVKQAPNNSGLRKKGTIFKTIKLQQFIKN